MSIDEYANQRDLQLQWQLHAQANAFQPSVTIRCLRPKPIDPKAKLSDKAALLLSVNHLLRAEA